jgi:hypothetical protein
LLLKDSRYKNNQRKVFKNTSSHDTQLHNKLEMISGKQICPKSDHHVRKKKSLRWKVSINKIIYPLAIHCCDTAEVALVNQRIGQKKSHRIITEKQ